MMINGLHQTIKYVIKINDDKWSPDGQLDLEKVHIYRSSWGTQISTKSAKHHTPDIMLYTL